MSLGCSAFLNAQTPLDWACSTFSAPTSWKNWCWWFFSVFLSISGFLSFILFLFLSLLLSISPYSCFEILEFPIGSEYANLLYLHISWFTTFRMRTNHEKGTKKTIFLCRYPLTGYQAFCICLASIDSKLCCTV